MSAPSPLMFASKRQLSAAGHHPSIKKSGPVKRKEKLVKQNRKAVSAPVFSTDTTGNTVNNYKGDSNGHELSANELKFWWECLRKHGSKTEAEALEVIQANDAVDTQSPYKCGHCKHWHVGRNGNGRTLTKLNDVVRQWRKRKDKPTADQVKAAFENPAREADKYWKERNFLQAV